MWCAQPASGRARSPLVLEFQPKQSKTDPCVGGARTVAPNLASSAAAEFAGRSGRAAPWACHKVRTVPPGYPVGSNVGTGFDPRRSIRVALRHTLAVVRQVR